MKKPWLAALLNFFFWGMGYVYVGKRIAFGILIFLVGLIETVWAFYQGEYLLHPAYITASTIAAIAFTYDGYRNAQEVNRQVGVR